MKAVKLKYPKTNLEDVSIEFNTLDGRNISYLDSDSISDDLALSEKDASDVFDSPELSVSMSDSQENEDNTEANQAKKQLLLKILAFPTAAISRVVQPTLALPTDGIPRIVQPILHEKFESSQRVLDFEFEPNDGGFQTQFHPAFDVMERNNNANIRSSGSEAAKLEIDRLTDMLKDRRSQFRDLVKQNFVSNNHNSHITILILHVH